MRKFIAIVVLVALSISAFNVLAGNTGPIEQSGIGTVTIANTAPSVGLVKIFDTVSWTTSVDVNTELLFYVNVTDANGIDDIKEVVLNINVPGFGTTTGDPSRRYVFKYVEDMPNNNGISGVFSQVVPSGSEYINLANCVAPSNPALAGGSYVFSIMLNKTALFGSWHSQAVVTDSSASQFIGVQGTFNVYKWMQMAYSNGGSTHFGWSSAVPGAANVQDTFTVTVTANTIYKLSAAYRNMPYNSTANVSWGEEPSLEVVHSSTRVAVTNYTGPGFSLWYTSNAGGYNVVTTHTMELDIPSTLRKLSYTGMIIYIRAEV